MHQVVRVVYVFRVGTPVVLGLAELMMPVYCYPDTALLADMVYHFLSQLSASFMRIRSSYTTCQLFTARPVRIVHKINRNQEL